MTLLRPFLSTLFVASLSVAAVACSIVSPEDSTGGAPVANDKDAFIQQVCAKYQPCCTKAGKTDDGGARCRAFVTAFATGTYDAVAGNKCLSELQSTSSSTEFCEGGFSTPSCSRAIQGGGSAKPGESCSDENDCAASPEGVVECASFYKEGSTIRQCQVQVPGKLGDSPCVATVDGSSKSTSFSSSGESTLVTRGFLCDVKDGIRCDGTTQRCTAIAKLGEACQVYSSHQCTKDAYCESVSKTCVARKAVGAACTGSFDECVGDAYCDEGTKICKALLADGAACMTGTACRSRSCVNGKCSGSNLTTALFCAN